MQSNKFSLIQFNLRYWGAENAGLEMTDLEIIHKLTELKSKLRITTCHRQCFSIPW